jgi:O-antigen/teichoic acid export membrane protein
MNMVAAPLAPCADTSNPVMARGLTQRAVAGVLWTALATGAQALAQILALIILARLLSPREFGVFAVALLVIGLSANLAHCGIAPAIVQRPVLEERHLRVGFTLSVLFGLGAAALVWAAAPSIANFFQLPELTQVVRACCVVFALQGVSAVAEALAMRELRFRWLAGVDAVAFAVGFTGVGPVLAWLGFGVWALVGAHLVQNLIRAVVLVAGQPHPKRLLIERLAIGELLYFGGGFTVARICNYFATQADNLVVGRWLGAEALGLYTQAYQLMKTPAYLLGQILDRVLFPTMALVQLEQARLARAYRSGLSVCAVLTMPASVVLTIMAPEVVPVLLGPAWTGVVVPFQILALGMLFRTSYKIGDTIARATGAVYRRAWRQAAYALAVFVGALTGQRWGLTGVALGVLAAITLNFALMTQLSARLTGMRWAELGAAHLPGLALAATMGIPTWALAHWLRGLQTEPHALLAVVGLFVVVAGVLLCWSLPLLLLGKDVSALLRTLAALMPPRMRRQPSV